jgi:hypothetical protein
MSWFRSRSRLGAYLALFALAFQLAVSFGHVHLEHIAPASAGASALASLQPSADDLNAPSSPAGRERLADDCCPICTLIHLAGALVPAEMPSLPLPTVFGRLRLKATAEFDLTPSQGALFRARAPPIA